MDQVATQMEWVQTIEDSVAIDRPAADVLAFYSDFSNLPRFLGDVMAVEKLGARQTRWTIQGPLGVQVHWNAIVTDVAEMCSIFMASAPVWKIDLHQLCDRMPLAKRTIFLGPDHMELTAPEPMHVECARFSGVLGLIGTSGRS